MNCESSCDVKKNLHELSPTSSEECDNSQKSRFQENPVIYSLKESRSDFTCNLCNKSFAKERFLSYHNRIHMGKKPHVCNICNKSCIKTGDLKRHSLTHSGEKPHVCNICNKSFNRKGILKTHLLTHTGEKPHVCIICNKSFSLKAHLQRHEITHSGEKPHICNICSSSFGRKSHLSRHLLMHSRQNNKDPSFGKGQKLSSTSEKSKNVNSDSQLAETSARSSHGNNHPGELQAIEEIYYIVKEEHDISDEENNLDVGVIPVKSDADLHIMSCDIKEENIHDDMNDIVKQEHDIDYEEVVE